VQVFDVLQELIHLVAAHFVLVEVLAAGTVAVVLSDVGSQQKVFCFIETLQLAFL
jgi:hypothetical protein